MNFVGREKELREIRQAIQQAHSSTLLYGRRRFGKTTLLREALKPLDGVKVIYTCKPISLSDNAQLFSSLVFEQIGLSSLSADSFEQTFNVLKKQGTRFYLVLDEYQDLKKRADSDAVDSTFRDIIDNLSDNICLVLSGSSIRMMSALNEMDNPLFQRFAKVMKLTEMNYLESALFYPLYSTREKIMLYSVFGGIPLLNSQLDQSLSVEENIIRLFVEENGSARTYVSSVVETEILPIADAYAILRSIGNGMRKYKEIESCLRDEKSRAQLSRTLNNLLKADLIRKKKPINSDNKNHIYYEINNNALRFYFAYLVDSEDYIETNNPKGYFDAHIAPSFITFVSYRFEEIVRKWFSMQASCGIRPDIMRTGTYWYNDKKRKMNGEFDVALETNHGYEIYECKFLSSPMPLSLVKEELDKVRSVDSLDIVKVGFVSSSGFESIVDGAELFTAEDVYKTME